MNLNADSQSQTVDGPRYARFTRRLRGIAIDFVLFLLVLVGALQIAVALNSDDLARVVGFSVLAGFFLYEPLMVSLTGWTIGHYLSNLRVIDDRSSGNVSFLKAVVRVAIKAVLSWYSFVSMGAARRHQAVHDLLTRSTVQIRDPAKARPHHYSRERVELSAPGMPSRIRRLLVIFAYLLASFIISMFAAHALVVAGIYSTACGDFRRCSDAERWVEIVVGFCLLGLLALCVGLGWTGRLWGARRRTESVTST
jgi:RDD family protein